MLTFGDSGYRESLYYFCSFSKSVKYFFFIPKRKLFKMQVSLKMAITAPLELTPCRVPGEPPENKLVLLSGDVSGYRSCKSLSSLERLFAAVPR